MPTSSGHRIDGKNSNDTEFVRTNGENQLTREDIASIFYGLTEPNEISKHSSTARPALETLRANSPTFKRLIAVRNKLDKYLNSVSNQNSNSPEPIQPAKETPHLSNHEKPTVAHVRLKSSSSSSAHIRTKSHKIIKAGPLDKITYEKTCTRNGNIKQKCSLEIWLPKPGFDDEDDMNDDGHLDKLAPTPPLPDPPLALPVDVPAKVNNGHSPHSTSAKSRRSSIIKIITAKVSKPEVKCIDETSSKKSDPSVVPRLYHYEDYLTDQSEDRPRSSKSGNTAKSDGRLSKKITKRQPIHAHSRRLSASTNHTDETIPSGVAEKPMSSKNLLENIKQKSPSHETKTTIGTTNSLMINELMKKYSIIKKTHKEMTQSKVQLDKPQNESKSANKTTKDRNVSSPQTSETASFVSAEPFSVSVKKLLNDHLLPRSAAVHNNSHKTNERRSANNKPINPDLLQQTRLISIANNFQQRQISAIMSNVLLPAVNGKKNDDPLHSLDRSNTLNIMFDVPVENNVPSQIPCRPESPGLNLNKANGTETKPPRLSKRSQPHAPPAIRSDEQQQKPSLMQPLVQLVQYQNIQNSAQRYHNSTFASKATALSTTKSTLVHLKYSNGGQRERNCLVPE